MDLLRTHFARVQPLSDYLQLRTEADRTLCEGHIVCVAATEAADNAVPVECSQHSQGEHHQTEVVNNAIEHLVRNNVRNSVLSLGFTRLSNTENAAAVAGIHGVQNVWPNSAVSILKSNRWQHLLDRIGPRAMSHLLLSVSVFVELPNNCFVQLTGLAISELPNPSAAFTKFWLQGLNDKSCLKRPAELMGIPTILPAAKVIKLDSLKSTPTPTPLGSPRKTGNDIPIHPSICLKNNDIVIPRFKVFYKRPIHGASGRISYGLPKNHLLNRFTTSEYMFYILQTIFPRQFKLPNIFTTPKYQPKPIVSRQSLQIQLEQNEKPMRPPKRLSAASLLLSRFQILHNKFDYKDALHRYCPRRVRSDVPNFLLYQKNILELCIPYEGVSRFVRSVIRNVVPHGFWGNNQNTDTFLNAVEKFIQLQRFESFSLEFILKGIKISVCDWLISPNNAKNPPKHVPPNDMQKRLEIFSEFAYWIMVELVIPLLNSNFYVTESTSHKNKVFYFRHEDWAAMTHTTWKTLGQTTFRPLNQGVSQLMKNRTLSFSYIRLLPKENGFRPITNLRRRIVPRGVSSKEAKYAQSINSILQNAFQVLKYESGDVLKDGATVCGLTDIYPRLKAFKDRMRKVRPQQLYFVKADIVACFDNINQEKLMQILRDVVREEEYLIQKYSVTFASVGKVKREYAKRAKKSDDFTQFATLAKQLAGNMRNAIFTDNVVYSLEDREELLVLLEEHICNNLIKMGKRFYQQVLGIPQGSVLSSLLCSFFLSHMEKHKLGKLVSTNELLLRLVDDFLFVTPSKAKAIAFVQLLHQGISDYGCSVNPLKTVINFDLEDSGVKLKRVESLSELKSPQDFPWCGLLIDMKKLHVKVDYTRLSGTNISEYLSIEYSRKPWISLQLKMFHYIIPKCHAIFLDPNLNSEAVVLLNIYQNFMICAMKLYSHIHMMLRTLKCEIPPSEFLFNVIETTIKYTKGLVHSRLKNKTVGYDGLKLMMGLLKVEWLGYRAFSRVLKRKQASFSALLSKINERLDDEKYRQVRLKLQAVSCHSLSNHLDTIIY